MEGEGGGNYITAWLQLQEGNFWRRKLSLCGLSASDSPLVNNVEHQAPERRGLGLSHLMTKGYKRKERKKSQAPFLGLSVFRTISGALTPSVSIILIITRRHLSSPVLRVAAPQGCVQGHGTSKHGG